MFDRNFLLQRTTLGCLIQGGRGPNKRGGGGGNPSKKLINGGRKCAKNGFLRHLLETNVFYVLRTIYTLYAYVGFLRYLLETSAFHMLRTVYMLYMLMLGFYVIYWRQVHFLCLELYICFICLCWIFTLSTGDKCILYA